MVSVSQSTPRTFYFNPMLSCLSRPHLPVHSLSFSCKVLSLLVPRGTPAKDALLAATLPGRVASLASLVLGSQKALRAWGYGGCVCVWGDSLSTQPWDSFRSRTQSRQCSGLTTRTVPNPRTHCSHSP